MSGYLCHLISDADLGPDHGGHQLPGVHVDHGEGEGDVELPDHSKTDCPPGVGVDRNKDAGDAREASNHHRAEQDPPPPPLVHEIPTNEIGGDFNSGTENNFYMILRLSSSFY